MATVNVDFLVVGGGLSGLSAARALQDRGADYLLLERCPTLGGFTRTASLDDFCFDYTGHFLHLSKYASPSSIPFAELNDEDWQLVQRISKCYVAGQMVTAPIQYNLHELREPAFSFCRDSYSRRPALAESKSISFRDYIVSGFGQYLSDLFLIPQNEKTLAISLDRLSIEAVKRFFPSPDDNRVRAGMRRPLSDDHYNATFWYPKQGGIQRLVDGLSRGLKHYRTNEALVQVHLRQRCAVTGSGERFNFKHMLSTVPLIDLARACDVRGIRARSKPLTHSSTLSFNFGIRGPLHPLLQDVHWIYVPDRNIPFYRVGCYSNISSGVSVPGFHALYVEVGISSEQSNNAHVISDVERHVLSALSQLGWINAADIVCKTAHILRCAYIHHTHEREEAVRSLVEQVAEYNITPIGRYGRWDYISMEDSIVSAIKAVEEQAR